ncbi:uncharacterized protein PV09_03861 [Verruconis gallopava]|uniref:Uncharacterized protein n=1 Tax=Verruconis gallopava TaxID=253628 RepID=A0A0D2AEC3_9PEZI|nr:uncharacterized protein PV09_03861 [Verruconis gallopava]KIW05343.1 hypothetical protein PV09_03861 [Verruconis gallopava]
MDWTHDVCLSCDKQTQEGQKFCSQACRLADLERAGHYEPLTPASLPSNTPWESYQMSAAGTSTSRQYHFQLAPPVNFSACRQAASAESPPSSPKSRATHTSSSYFSHNSSSSTSSSHPTGRGLTLSPSRSSLSSVSSSGSALASPSLSEETMNQLRSYYGAFDQTRDWKRRVTYG